MALGSDTRPAATDSQSRATITGEMATAPAPPAPSGADIAEDPGFADLAELAAIACDMPMAGVLVVDPDGTTAGAWTGLHALVPLEVTPCAEVLRTGEAHEIADLRTDPRWDVLCAVHPCVSYAGVPVHDPAHGGVVGVMCVLGTEPRRLTPAQLRALTALAARVESELERRAASARHDEARSWFDAVVMGLTDGLLLEDAERRILVANQAFCDMLGLGPDPAELVGTLGERQIKKLLPNLINPEAFTARVKEIWGHGASVYGDEMHFVDGRVLVRDYVPVTSGGEVAHLWHFRDVSASRTAEARLGASEERFAALSEASPAAIFGLDERFNVTVLSPALRQQYRPDDAGDGWRWGDAFPADERERLRTAYMRALQDGRPMRFEHGLIDNTGQRREVAVSVMPAHVDNGRVREWIGTITDITERVRSASRLLESERERERERERRVRLERAARIAAEAAREELAERNAELHELHAWKDSLLASVSHELRTPLTAISTFAGLLSDSALGESDRELVAVIARNASRLEGVVEDLLLIKQGAEDLRLAPRALDLHRLAHESFAGLRPRATEEGIELVLADSTAPPAYATANRVGQIIDNLVTNAIKYTPRGGTVTARVEAVDAMVRLTIADTGPGMPPAELAQVWESFYQGQAGQGSGSGSGLGMTIVKILAERQGGAVDIASAVGRGTTVTVDLPMAPGGRS